MTGQRKQSAPAGTRGKLVHSDKIRRAAIFAMVLLLATDAAATAQQPISAAATVDGEVLSLDEVDRTIAGSVAALEEQIFQLRRQRLEALIAE